VWGRYNAWFIQPEQFLDRGQERPVPSCWLSRFFSQTLGYIGNDDDLGGTRRSNLRNTHAKLRVARKKERE